MTINLLDTGFVGSLLPADPDAAAYIAAVEAADGQALEDAVRASIRTMVTNIKAVAGLWPSINILAPLAGPRTLAGCAVPLKGPQAFTFTNFTAAEYDRKQGVSRVLTQRVLFSAANYVMDTAGDIAFGALKTSATVPTNWANPWMGSDWLPPSPTINYQNRSTMVLAPASGSYFSIRLGGGWGLSNPIHNPSFAADANPMEYLGLHVGPSSGMRYDNNASFQAFTRGPVSDPANPLFQSVPWELFGGTDAGPAPRAMCFHAGTSTKNTADYNALINIFKTYRTDLIAAIP